VISAVDIHDVARDQLGAVKRQEGGRIPDVVDADESALRHLGLFLIVQGD